MKKIFLLLSFIVAALNVEAQTFINNTNCDFSVDRYCMKDCNTPVRAYVPLLVQGNTTVIAPPIIGCALPNFIAYDFCWVNFDPSLCPPPITACTGRMAVGCTPTDVYWVTPCSACSQEHSIIISYDAASNTWTINYAP